jgi:metal-responsive CopG/Arc/MetJ family transcriptional regulator
MKTAISIPDSVFLAAEQLGHQMGISRSELYTSAIRVYLTSHRYNNVTQLLNEIYKTEDSGLDSEIKQLQFNSLSQDEKW